MKLSKTQQKALKKLTKHWQSSYTLQENRNTLNSLVRLELAEVNYNTGASFFPRTGIVYKKKEINNEQNNKRKI